MNKLEVAERAERALNEMEYGYEMKRAVLFAVVSSPNEAVTLTEITSNGDVYDLLNDKVSIKALADHDQVLVATCGWAAPVDDDDENDADLPPSVHPKRRRVRLACFLNDEGVTSVLRFGDTPDETVTDEGSARGSLADALEKLRKKARTRTRTRKRKK
jgi:hypothetical protein